MSVTKIVLLAGLSGVGKGAVTKPLHENFNCGYLIYSRQILECALPWINEHVHEYGLPRLGEFGTSNAQATDVIKFLDGKPIEALDWRELYENSAAKDRYRPLLQDFQRQKRDAHGDGYFSERIREQALALENDIVIIDGSRPLIDFKTMIPGGNFSYYHDSQRIEVYVIELKASDHDREVRGITSRPERTKGTSEWELIHTSLPWVRRHGKEADRYLELHNYNVSHEKLNDHLSRIAKEVLAFVS